MNSLLGSLQGSPIDFVIAFVAGVLMSFSPCVFPLVPITLGFIGAKGVSSRSKGFFLSLIYVLGIAITYSALGLTAALTGKLFGMILNSWIIQIMLGNICIIAGLMVLEVIRLPVFDIVVHANPRREGFFGTFVMGLLSGFAVSPCVVPVLGSILSIVAARHDLVRGASLLFVFAYGMGALLILVGTFAGLLTALPRLGHWLNTIKKIYGFILIVAGEFFLVRGGTFFFS